MKKKKTKTFFILGIVFYILLFAGLGLGLQLLRNRSAAALPAAFTLLEKQLSTALEAEAPGAEAAERLKREIAGAMAAEPRFLGISLYERGPGGLQYYFVKNDRYLQDPQSLPSETTSAAWWNLNDFRHAYAEKDFTAGNRPFRVSAAYQLLTTDEVFSLIRWAVAAVLLFLIINAAYLLKRLRSAEANEDGGEAAKEPEGNVKTAAVETRDPSAVPVEEADPEAGQEPHELFSPATGLVWESFLLTRLESELKRAAAYDQDACLLLCQLHTRESDDGYLKMVKTLKENYDYPDLLFEYGSGGAALVLPNVDMDEGLAMAENLRKAVDDALLGSSCVTAAGLSSRNGRIIEAERLMKECRTALQKALNEENSTLIAFRSDLEKYREFIARKR